MRPAAAQGPAPHWRNASPARQQLYAEVLGGRICIAGGLLSPNTGYSAHLEVYDPASGRWSAIADASTARNSAASAVIDGRLYVVGGRQALPQPGGRRVGGDAATDAHEVLMLG